MKIKTKRKGKYVGAFLLSSFLYLTGCKENNISIETENNFAKFESQLSQLHTITDTVIKIAEENDNKDFIYYEEKLSERDFEKYVEEEFQNISVIVEYYHLGYLYISINEEYQGDINLPEEFYTKLNMLLQQIKINSIDFQNMDNRLDFSKIDFSSENVKLKRKELSYYNYNKVFDYSKLPKDFDAIYFNNTSLAVVEGVLSNCNVEDTRVYWEENIENQSNLKSFLEYLVENDIATKQLHIKQINNGNYNALTSEECELLGKVNVPSIYVELVDFKKPLCLDIALNDNIQDFHVDAYGYDENHSCIFGELGTIKVESNAKELGLDFSYANITENTHFSLPDIAWVSLGQLTCTDISAFHELKNIEYLWFKDYSGPGPEGDLEGEIRYCKDTSIELVDAMTSEPAELYRDYEEVLKDLKMYFSLYKLRKNLNVSLYENGEYYYTPSIGDIVNLASDDVLVYGNIESLKNQENAVSSYYGTSILRCISAICMTNGKENVEVNNMEDYEAYINAGYTVIGYQLVNLNSINPDGTLTGELRCNKDDIRLFRTPFNR